jgi:hypothetical protein
MRKLTAKQKTLLRKWRGENSDLFCWADLSWEEMTELEEINDTEILQQEVNRFLGDLE